MTEAKYNQLYYHEGHLYEFSVDKLVVLMLLENWPFQASCQNQQNLQKTFFSFSGPIPQKLDKCETAKDDGDRLRKVLESRAMVEEGRMAKLEEQLRQVRVRADAADIRFDEVQVKDYIMDIND